MADVESRFEQQAMSAGPLGPRIAVLLPCYNEEAAIGQTVAGFRAALPTADIYVYDNNSKDRTREVAAAAGAIVRTERMQGKGHVVRRMFADVEADIYIMADGDSTYDAAAAPDLVAKLIDEQLDMVVARASPKSRRPIAAATSSATAVHGHPGEPVRPHLQRHLLRLPGLLPPLRQELSGARTRLRNETEISVHALELVMPVGEVVTAYGARPEGSVSKLSTYRDGWRIMKTILHLFRIERPVLFYGGFGLFLAVIALTISVPLVITFAQTGLVPRFPTAILATGLMIVAFMSFMCGLILDTVVRGRREVRRLHYLALPGVADLTVPQRGGDSAQRTATHQG
jgi:hypothetical protein